MTGIRKQAAKNARFVNAVRTEPCVIPVRPPAVWAALLPFQIRRFCKILFSVKQLCNGCGKFPEGLIHCVAAAAYDAKRAAALQRNCERGRRNFDGQLVAAPKRIRFNRMPFAIFI